MAPRVTDRKAAKIRDAVEVSTEILDSFGLEPGDIVHFRLSETQRWTEASVRGENSDGSLTLVETKSNRMRSIRPEKIERKTHGPRGGVVWEPLLPV